MAQMDDLVYGRLVGLWRAGQTLRAARAVMAYLASG